ncbi:MAG: hypothetical protein M1281_04655 [Chloroflexi bacterium]|nr:hypothetical protein [Chloroflexota bacterium]
MAGKYDPFGRYLLSIPSQTLDVTLSFLDIQEVLKFSLPASALQYQTWWTYEVHPKQSQKLCWQNTGWRVEEVNFSRRQVRFHRFSPPNFQDKAEPIVSPISETGSLPNLVSPLPVRSIPDLSLTVHNPAWTPVFAIPQSTILLKGRHGLYPQIIQAAAAVNNRYGCYSWGSQSEVYYCGSFAQDYILGGFKSNLHARVHNYLQNHRINETGQKNTNLMVFEKINEALVKEDIILSVFSFEGINFTNGTYNFSQYCEDPDLVHTVEQLLISWYRKQGQCQWNRT